MGRFEFLFSSIEAAFSATVEDIARQNRLDAAYKDYVILDSFPYSCFCAFFLFVSKGFLDFPKVAKHVERTKCMIFVAWFFIVFFFARRTTLSSVAILTQ